MSQHQPTREQRAAQSAEAAVIIALLGIGARQGYASVARRRWRRGKTMTGPATIYVAIWTALAVTWFVRFMWVGHRPGSTYENALAIDGFAVAIWITVGVLTWVAGLITLAVWEALVWFGHTDTKLNANRGGHWLSVGECRATKAQLEAGLRSRAPTLVMGGLIVAAGDGGGYLGAELSTVYVNYAKPWLDWDRAEAQLLAGQQVWYNDPPPPAQTISIVGPYLGLGLSAA
jgi:hypothetical protein